LIGVFLWNFEITVVDGWFAGLRGMVGKKNMEREIVKIC